MRDVLHFSTQPQLIRQAKTAGIVCLAALAMAYGLCLREAVSADAWSVDFRSSLALDTTGVAAKELSGVTYLGLSPEAGKHRFSAIQDSEGRLITLDVELSPTGSLGSATAVSAVTMSSILDFEGAAYTDASRNSVFLSEEGSPGVQEYDLDTGSLLQSVSIPSVFSNRVGNRGFESLTRNPAGTVMWTANEEALSVDGPLATASAGSPVRLLEMNVAGNIVSTGSQYVYEVEPIHNIALFGTTQSGLVDLVSLPDGTLISLERSLAASLSGPPYLSRIYQIDFTGATDVSTATYAAGLAGQTYTPVTKHLLWSGTADGANGQNLEGLTLGPRLSNDSWALLGVVDDSNGSDPFSSNTIVSFELSATASADFDENTFVDGFDFLAWQRGFGRTVGALLAHGDADRDGDVDTNDLTAWETALGPAPVATALQIVPEPTASTLLMTAMLSFYFRSIRRSRLRHHHVIARGSAMEAHSAAGSHP